MVISAIEEFYWTKIPENDWLIWNERDTIAEDNWMKILEDDWSIWNEKSAKFKESNGHSNDGFTLHYFQLFAIPNEEAQFFTIWLLRHIQLHCIVLIYSRSLGLSTPCSFFYMQFTEYEFYVFILIKPCFQVHSMPPKTLCSFYSKIKESTFICISHIIS